MTKKKVVIVICIIFLAILIGIGTYFLLKKDNVEVEEQEKVALSFKEITLETGSLVPTINDFLENGEIEDSATITFEKIDAENETKWLNTIFLYKDINGNLVSEEEAFELDSDILKENITEEERIVGVGKYRVIIKNENNTYETVLTIEDKESPILEVAQNIKVTEGDNIEINSFIKSCSDNSYIDCSYALLDSNSKEVEIPSKVGTYSLKIVAFDESKNKTEKEVTLTIEEKKKPTTNSSTNTNKGNSISKPNTNNSSNNNSTNGNTNTSNSNKEKPWEKLGMTEYHYYNEPMYSYDRVDFSVEKYGTEESCINACREYGLSYEPYKQGKVLFGCSTVNTASGKYLGEMFYTEELKN